MNRRELIHLSVASALAGVVPAMGAASPSGSRKKGFGQVTKKEGWERRIQMLRCKWFYSWGASLPGGKAPAGIDFVPMIWGYWGNEKSVAKAGQDAKAAGIKELLGFNEPDKKSQSNMSVEKALAAWRLLEETGLRLGSPACVHPDNDWMRAFMNEAKKQKRKVDFVCVHSYGGPNPDAFIKKLEATHKLYGKPVWITEFAIGDWEAKTAAANRHRPDQVLRFMESVIPKLEQLDFVERYAWFSADQDSAALGTSALIDTNGELTRLGECYRDA